MKRYERWFMIGAGTASLVLHAAFVLLLLDVQIGSTQAALFDPGTNDTRELEVYRWPDEYLESTPSTDPSDVLAADRSQSDRSPQIQKTSQQLLKQSDPRASLPVDPSTKVTGASLEPSDLEPRAPGEPQLADRTAVALVTAGDLVRAASPAIDLPTYVQPTDEPDLAAPPTGRIDVSRGTGGTSVTQAVNGSGGSAGTGFGFGVDPTLPPPPVPPQVAPPAPPVFLPEIEPNPADRVPEIKPDKPQVRLDSDFDFELRIWAGPLRRSAGWFGSDEVVNEREGWFELQIRPRPSLRRLKPLAKDVVYVIDTSASISRSWLGAVKSGVAGALDSLNPGDRFNVVMFHENVTILEPNGWLEASDASRARARTFVNEAARAGYTDVDRALRQLVRRDVGDDRVYQVIFISDGRPTSGSISAKQIIDVFTRANNLVAGIYCVAVGEEVNTSLLGALAYRNKGYVVRPAKANQAAAAIRDLASRLRYPILKDTVFNAAGVDTRQIFPRQPRDVYQHEPISIFGRFEPTDTRVNLRLVGQTPTQQMTFGSTLTFDRATPADRNIADGWATAHLYHLTSEMLRRPADSRGDLERQIEQLKKTYGLK